MSEVNHILFDVFREISDHFNWDKHIEYAARGSEVEESKRKEWIEVLTFLKQELGTGFLKTSGKNHALFRKVTEKAPWRTAELIAFVTTLQRLKNSDSNYIKLIRKMGSAQTCEKEGIPFTEIAQMYLNSGFRIRFPEEIQGQKNADIEIQCPVSNDQFYIEVSKLAESEERNLLDGNYKVLSHEFNFQGYCLPFSCAQLRYIAPEEMPGVLSTIKSIKEMAFEKRDIIYYADDKIRLTMAHPDKVAELENWIECHDYRKGLLGPPLNFNETNRISNYKIEQEIIQIPPNVTGLIYIPANALYFWGPDFAEATGLLQRRMNNYPNLLGLAVYAYLIHDITPVSVVTNGHYYSIKKMNDVVIRHFLFVRNTHYKGRLAETTIKKIYSSFE